MMTILLIDGKRQYAPVLNDTLLTKGMVIKSGGKRRRIKEIMVDCDAGEMIVELENL